jgi:uncharacterized protein with HEPN domain
MGGKSDTLPLVHMLDAIEQFESFLGPDLTADGLADDRLRRAAVERTVEIISEASRRLPKAWKERFPDLPWSQIAGIGNVLRHGYEWVDLQIIVGLRDEGHLSRFKDAVETLLAEEEPNWRLLRAERKTNLDRG